MHVDPTHLIGQDVGGKGVEESLWDCVRRLRVLGVGGWSLLGWGKVV